MIWTILTLVVAVVLYFLATKLKKNAIELAGSKKKVSMYSCKSVFFAKLVKLVSIILLIIGVNMTGFGTRYYLTKSHPEILQDMVEGMKAKESELQKAKLKKVLKSGNDLMKNAPVAGNEKGTKTIYLFAAHSCGYCKMVHQELVKVLAKNPDVKVVLKPLSIHGPMSDAPAKAIIAAKLQDNAKAVALDNALMTKAYYPANLDRKDMNAVSKAVEEGVLKLSESVGLDAAQLKKDMDTSAVVAEEMESIQVLAKDLGISGTPYLIIENQPFPGALRADKIEEALK